MGILTLKHNHSFVRNMNHSFTNNETVTVMHGHGFCECEPCARTKRKIYWVQTIWTFCFFALHSLETRVPFDVKKNYKKAKKFSGFHSHLSPTSFQRILSIAEFLGCENQTKMPIQMKKNQKFRFFF